MCRPKNDHLIVELLESGRIRVDASGMGSVEVRDGNSGKYRPAAERVQQGGNRPYSPEYREIIIWHGKRNRTLRVNRVIYVALHGPTHLEIDHIDDDPLNCGGTNLHAKTRQENQDKANEAKWMRKRGEAPPEDECTSSNAPDAPDAPVATRISDFIPF